VTNIFSKSSSTSRQNGLFVKNLVTRQLTRRFNWLKQQLSYSHEEKKVHLAQLHSQQCLLTSIFHMHKYLNSAVRFRHTLNFKIMFAFPARAFTAFVNGILKQPEGLNAHLGIKWSNNSLNFLIKSSETSLCRYSHYTVNERGDVLYWRELDYNETICNLHLKNKNKSNYNIKLPS